MIFKVDDQVIRKNQKYHAFPEKGKVIRIEDDVYLNVLWIPASHHAKDESHGGIYSESYLMHYCDPLDILKEML